MTDFSAEHATPFLAHLGSDGCDQELRDHLISVSGAARERAGKIGLGAAGATVGLLHDLGKYSHDFQQYLRRMGCNQDTEQASLERGTIDHSTAGAQTVWRGLRDKGRQAAVAGEILSLCIASHHSGLIDCITPDGTDKLSRRMRKADSESHYEEAWANAEKPVVEGYERNLQDPHLTEPVCDFIRRLCRIDSNETIVRFKVGLLVRFLFSCLIDADRTDTADFTKRTAASLRQHGRYVEWPVLANLLERKLQSFSGSTAIGRLRKQVSDSCLSASLRPKGIYTLTVPTGGGKTLAALRFALNHAAERKMDRIIYVCPYTSIIDQNAEEVRKILEPFGTEFGSVVLEHHSNLTPAKETWRSKVLSENWDAPVVFTTAVQVLESLFGSATRAVRRMHQMANAILIFDEVQTIPVRCVHLFNNAINFLVEQCGTTVLLCTATQPLLDRVDGKKGAIRLEKNAEIMPDVEGLFAKLQRTTICDRRRPGGWEYVDAANLAISETRRSGSCLFIVNTKNEALSIFKACNADAGDVPLYHLSTGMCPAHRMDILGEIRELLLNRAPVICVSTQLIEAGVDIDFGSVICALAGLDSIAQAAGRCNRHGARETGHVHVMNLAGELPKSLRDIRAAQEAGQRLLDENPGTGPDSAVDLSNPKLIERYFDYYFFDRRQEMDYPIGADQAERDDTLLNMLAQNTLAVAMCKVPPPMYLRQAFMTAAQAFEPIDANTRGVIVPYKSEGKAVISELCAAHEPKKQFTLLKRAARFSVNVFPYVLEKLQAVQAVHEVQDGTGILYLDEKFYNGVFGLNEKGSEDMEFQDV